MRCRIEYRLDGTPGYAEREAETSIDGLLQWLETVPQTASVKALVKVLVPTEIAQ